MKTVYIVMVDLDGMMRSTCDTPRIVCNTKQEAEDYIKYLPKGSYYAAKIVECQYYDAPVKTSEGFKCKLIDRKGFVKDYVIQQQESIIRIADFKPVQFDMSYDTDINPEASCLALEFYYERSENGIAIYVEK